MSSNRLLGVLIAAGVALLAVVLIRQSQQYAAFLGTLKPGVLLLSLSFLVPLYFLDGYGWHLVLRFMGAKLPAMISIKIWVLSSITRYIPGGIWGYASRVTMAQQHEVSLKTAAISLYTETVLLGISSFIVGLPALGALGGKGYSPSYFLTAGLLMTALLHRRVIGLMRRLPGKLGRLFGSLPSLSMAQLVILYLYYFAFWIALGLTFTLFLSAFVDVKLAQWPYLSATFCLSFCVGLIAFFAPSGIGVREGVLFTLLLPVLPTGEALAASVLSRLWFGVGEFLTVALVLSAQYFSTRPHRRRP